MSAIPQPIQDANTILGILGFFITLLVMFQVRSIKKSFKSKALLPDIVSEIESKGSALNKLLPGWPNTKNEIKVTIKSTHSLINTSLQFATNPEKKEIKRINGQIKLAILLFETKKYNNLNAIWDIYGDIQTAITNLKQNSKNIHWD